MALFSESTTKDINVFLVGFSFFLVFTAFGSLTNIQPVIIESAKMPNSTAYVEHFSGNGYYSLAIIYALFTFFSTLTPSLIAVTSTKVAMLLGSIAYVVYVASFFYLNDWVLYGCSALVGMVAALIWVAQGAFLTKNSTQEKITRNAGVFWAMYQSARITGSTIIYYFFKGKDIIDHDTRLTVVGVLFCISVLGMLSFFLLLPTPWVNSKDKSEKNTPFVALKESLCLLRTPKMLQLMAQFIYIGLEISFWSGIYGPCLGFTKSFDDPKSLTGLHGTFLGLGGLCAGLTLGLFGRFIVSWGRFPVVMLGTMIHMTSYMLIYLNVPIDAPFGETDSVATIQPSSAPIAIACSVMLGIGDACCQTQLISLLGSLYTDNPSAAFAAYKIVECLATTAGFLCSGFVPLYYQLGILALFGLIGSIFYARVEVQSEKNWTICTQKNLCPARKIPQSRLSTNRL